MNYQQLITSEISRLKSEIASGLIVESPLWDLDATFETFFTRYYLLALTVNGIISSLLHVVVWYVIMFKTPKEMHDYRMYLFNISICSFLHDFFISMFWRPVPMFPNLICANTGLVRHFGPRAANVGIVICIPLVALYILSIVNGFIYRIVSLSNQKYRRFLQSKCGLMALSLVQFGPTLLLGAMLWVAPVPVQLLREKVLAKSPQLAPFFDTESMFGYDADINPWIHYACAVGVVWIIIIIPTTEIVCCVMSSRQLRQIRQHISAHTYRMHKNLIIVLFIQITLPNIMILLPTAVIVIGVWRDVPYMNILAEGTFMMCSIHSVIDNLIMLIAITPYRLSLKNMIFKTLKIKIDGSMNNGHPSNIQQSSIGIPVSSFNKPRAQSLAVHRLTL